MKTKRITILAIMLSAMVSCNDETIEDVTIENPEVITGLTEEVYFEETGSINSIGLIEHYELMIQQATAGNAEENASFIEYLQGKLDEAEEYTDECINQAGANWDAGADGGSGKNKLLGYEYTTIRYKSIDHNGNPVMLSTLVVWPYNNIFADPDADNVIIGCHVTYGSNAERPTNYDKNSIMSDVGMIACGAKSNGGGSDNENLVIIPDYQGFGATHGEVHPYLSQDLTARQVLDGVRAGIAYYQKTHKLEKDWRGVSTGYSQGGSVAMAVHRYIEKNDLVSEFRFAGSVCGSGPYDPVATLDTYISTDKTFMPVTAAMMIYSMCNTNPRLKGKYSPEDFMSEQFLNSNVIKMIEEKVLNTDQMQEQLLQYSAKFKEDDKTTLTMYRLADDDEFHPYRSDTKDKYDWESGYIRTAYVKTSDIMRPEVIEWFRSNGTNSKSDKCEALKGALNDNVLYNDWKPAHPIFMFHTEEDEVVVVENYRKCLEAWEGSDMVKGKIYKGTTETHVSYGSVFFIKHCDYGMCAILDGTYTNHEFDGKIYDLV